MFFVKFEILIEDPELDKVKVDPSVLAKPIMNKIDTEGNVYIKFTNNIYYKKPKTRRL